MAEVNSLISASAGLIDVTAKLLEYVNELRKGCATIDEDLDALAKEMATLKQIAVAVEDARRSQRELPLQTISDATADHIAVSWQHLGQTMDQCTAVVEKVHTILSEIHRSPPISSKLENWARVHRQRSSRSDLDSYRNQIMTYHSSIHILLSLVQDEESRDSHHRTKRSVEDLKTKIDTLISRLPGSKEELNGSLTNDREEDFALQVLRTSLIGAAKILAPPSYKEYFKTPQAVSSIFTGRESLLEELNHRCIQPPGPLRIQSQRRFVVCGLGGSGKTQFCCKFAEDNRDRVYSMSMAAR
ncbi:hypothetical protein F4778DRAFT_776945 [Xylariomycetidae sp. FL2044]|nr:hypothetical protein F4778DRAFT_776945 [Xylariomycetidae sp. FL2044]